MNMENIGTKSTNMSEIISKDEYTHDILFLFVRGPCGTGTSLRPFGLDVCFGLWAKTITHPATQSCIFNQPRYFI